MFSPKRNQNGFTLVELFMVLAVATVVYLGIMALIGISSKSMWSIKHYLGLNDQASDAMQLISTDFKNAKASSMGNLAENPGFEDPLAQSSSPNGWEALPVDVTKTGFYGADIKSGMVGIKVSNGAAYRSNNFTLYALSPGNKYIVSAWGKNTGSADLVDTSDVALLGSSISNMNSYWTHISTSFAPAATVTARLRVRSPAAPGWNLLPFTAVGNMVDLTAMAVYRNKVFAGYWETGDVFSYSSSSGTYEVNGTVGINPHVSAMCVYDPDGAGPDQERLLMVEGMWDWGNAWSWAYFNLYFHQGDVAGSWSGSTWGPNNSFGVSLNPPAFVQDSGWFSGRHFYRSLYANPANGFLYMGTHGWSPGFFGELREFNPATGWRLLWTSPENMISALCVFQNRIYAGTANGSSTWHIPAGTGNIYVYDIPSDSILNGGAPVVLPAAFRTRFSDMIVFNNRLYAAAGSIFVFDGGVWTAVSTLGDVTALGIYGGQLFAGNKARQIYRTTDGINWNAFPNTGLGAISWIKDIVECNGAMYLGGSNSGWGATGVYIWGDTSFFDDVSISPEETVFDRFDIGMSTYTYHTSSGTQTTTEGTVNRFNKFAIVYEPITDLKNPAWPGKLYRKRYDGAKWQPAGLKPDGTFCENVERLRIFNRNQETFDVELYLEKQVEKQITRPGGIVAGPTKRYRLVTTITPNTS